MSQWAGDAGKIAGDINTLMDNVRHNRDNIAKTENINIGNAKFI